MPYIPSARDVTSLYPEGMPTIATIATTIVNKMIVVQKNGGDKRVPFGLQSL